MAADNVTRTRPASLAQQARRIAALITAVTIGLLAVACSRSGAAANDHGVVIGHLAIPFVPKPTRGSADVIKVSVRAGQRFSIKVDTSDGPAWWSQVGAKPDSRVVKVVGDYDIGSCPGNLPGCRVPYYHTLLARGQGATIMTWRYFSAPCRAPTTSPARKQCPSVTEVQFDIQVR